MHNPRHGWEIVPNTILKGFVMANDGHGEEIILHASQSVIVRLIL